MAEPTSTATIVTAAVVVPALTAFGIPLGLRPDVLIAGFSGSLAAILLFDSVPSTGDTVRELVRTTLRRMGVCFSSSLTAGYLAPMLPLLMSMSDPALLFWAFVTGTAAQQVLRAVIKRCVSKIAGAASAGQEGPP